MVGVGVGRRVGTSVGRAVVGSSVGKAVGRSDGTQEGVMDGRSVGVSVGLVEGTYVGDSLNGASVTCTMTLRWERGPRGRETRSVRPSRYPVHRRCPTATAAPAADAHLRCDVRERAKRIGRCPPAGMATASALALPLLPDARGKLFCRGEAAA